MHEWEKWQKADMNFQHITHFLSPKMKNYTFPKVKRNEYKSIFISNKWTQIYVAHCRQVNRRETLHTSLTISKASCLRTLKYGWNDWFNSTTVYLIEKAMRKNYIRLQMHKAQPKPSKWNKQDQNTWALLYQKNPKVLAKSWYLIICYMLIQNSIKTKFMLLNICC